MIDKHSNEWLSRAQRGQASFLSVIGPTASGKSSLALGLAQEFGAELVNCDSVQVYRGFDIGSAKPSAAEQDLVPHHLLDCVSWHEDYDAARFAEMARSSILEINRRGKLAIVVGGSGLYLRFLWGQSFHELPSDPVLREELNSQDSGSLYKRLQSLDPLRAEQLHPKDKFRITRAIEINLLAGKTISELTKASVKATFPPLGVIFINRERSELHERIAQRASAMLAQGFLDEVKSLLALGCPHDAKPMQSIGYKQAVDYLEGQSLYNKAQLLEKIIVATRQYAKRQLTWYRKVQHDIAIDNSQITPQLVEDIESCLGTKQD
ncbi:MAG: tRNA (adenosine(37)-N6)-dimethylallyltransferase MiaA [Oligoflexales bacterium]|nr:tRNA (adenosine(37)-N6)-dimethylallyltransferase MiaA [Oligoflexales bacterium]